MNFELGSRYADMLMENGIADSVDIIYGPLFDPFPIVSKIVSTIPEYEFETEKKPQINQTTVNLEASLHEENGDPITINSSVELRPSIDPTEKGWDFGTLPITLQRYDPNHPYVEYPIHDVRKADNWDQAILFAQMTTCINLLNLRACCTTIFETNGWIRWSSGTDGSFLLFPILPLLTFLYVIVFCRLIKHNYMSNLQKRPFS